ncbi:asialoglycoprotein receptor 1-like [Podarcis raffonei]|uniref:asialoglycoprotein receptor 1-like n=1 Tax=Podarcis raffonei TaxID=65483 RepID=UPI0023299BCC|nr:asialoglycoprotein receptor 1-like [Podarcis raffonei]
MSRDYNDLATMSEDGDCEIQLRNASQKRPPGLSWRQRICPSRRLVLILLGVGAILTIAIIVFGAKGSDHISQLLGLKDEITSMNQSLGEGMVASQHKEADTEAKMKDLEGKVKELAEKAEAAKTQLLTRLKDMQKSFRLMYCELEDFKNNRTEECCPKGWDFFRKSCYWESGKRKSWEEAKVNCEVQNAHLVIIDSIEEQQFVAVRVHPQYMWIGLTYTGGSWKWVDGRPYTFRQGDWVPGQPDNSSSHGLLGGENCVHFHSDGRWTDDHCTLDFGWICEMEITD